MSAPVKTHESFGLNSQFQQLLWWDDFLGDVLDDRWNAFGDAGGTAVVVDSQTGGIVRITSDGDINDDWQINWNIIRSLIVSKKVCMEVRVKINDFTNVSALFGLDRSSTERILFLANTSIGVNWQAFTRNGGASTTTDTGIAVTTNYVILRIEVVSDTSVLFYIDDVLGATITTNIPSDAGDYLQPLLRILTLETATKSVDIDYVVIRQER